MLQEYEFNSPELKKIWMGLYRDNPYLFPFSSYEYNHQVYAYEKFKLKNYLKKNHFLVYFEKEEPLVLLPLTVKGNEIFLFGDDISGCDNLDLVYDQQISHDSFTKMLLEFSVRFPQKVLKFYKINERSRFYQYISENQKQVENQFKLKIEEDRVCVKVLFPKDYETYFSALSRNCKSNLKKAYNKAIKMDADMNLKVVKGPVLDHQLLSAMMHVYAHRESERKHRKFDFLCYVKNRYFSVLSWAAQHMQSQYTFCLFLHNTVAAFMSGFETNFGEIVFPRVAMNSQFSKYAPGKLMISESVKWLQKNTDINGLDLSRGDERYKYEMGGKKHMNYRFFLYF
ncbi:GNAT family N-acetyltransferase [Acidaminococcus timonensis]|uniref:GNAT family N-acetyltransferase n=1 Tax=Acidaminococcus timonensis TaxID=1871002 RepID=UPI00294275E9|nr:GNAT family N-acetyltransferase [Acidaminococcus timonensis]